MTPLLRRMSERWMALIGIGKSHNDIKQWCRSVVAMSQGGTAKSEHPVSILLTCLRAVVTTWCSRSEMTIASWSTHARRLTQMLNGKREASPAKEMKEFGEWRDGLMGGPMFNQRDLFF